jgi:antitoxin ParD1/3/4
MPSVTISLPDSLREFVEQQVERRGYGNVSEYFRTLLREAQERDSERRLEELLLVGLESGECLEANPPFWAGLKADVAQRVAAREGRRRRA